MAKVEKTNEIEKPAEPAEQVGEEIAVTNQIEGPVIYYSDVPGAGPEDVPDEEENEEEAVEGDEPGMPKPAKAQAAAANKAQAPKVNK
jgi:hypothetical protein